ncbi:MAG: SAM-dependent methyltransferase [Anaerolineae bacterium]
MITDDDGLDMAMMDDYRALVRERILEENTFVRATFTGRAQVPDADSMPWRRLVIRPVDLKSGRHLQFSYFDEKKDITKNYAGKAAHEQIELALGLPFANILVQTTDGEVQVQITRKGKPIVHVRRADQPRNVDAAHDHEKSSVLAGEDAYLKVVGIMTADGRIKAAMDDKYQQINEFLKMMADTGALDSFASSPEKPIRVFDAGCGNAYLTFALYHYLTAVREWNVELTGVDVKADLMARHNENAAELGWDGLHFEASTILDYQPAEPPEIVVALHACDTATDDAIAQGIRWGSRLIVCAPCCHHHLQAQLHDHPAPVPFAPVLRYGILHERMGDLLTDTFRAQTLRMHGYRTDVIEFVGDEHTPRNVMIRAVKTNAQGDSRAAQEYEGLKTFWGVTPYLEGLLGQ